jgi:HSP20 family protein
MARQMSKLVDQINKGYYNFCPSDETWTPSVNLYETERAYLVCVDLAGVDKDKIELLVHEHRLKLKGTRQVPTHENLIDNDGSQKKVRVHLMEIDHGSFTREVELPHDVLQEQITAQYVNGMLWVEIPKK